MPRDDLSIDFVRRMPQAEPLDPGLILDDWTNRVQNLPEEIKFIQEEILDKDRQYSDAIRLIEDRDAKIQRWIKTNGSHEPNPREDLLRAQIRESYTRADQLSHDKIALSKKLQMVMDKHLHSIDIQIKLLYDRSEPSFMDPDEVPSLLRPSAANHTAPSVRAINPANTMSAGGTPISPANPAATSAATSTPSLAVSMRHPNPQIRNVQAQQQTPQQAPSQLQPQAQQHAPQQQQQHQLQHAASAPTTPAAPNRPREGSAGPASKRGPRVNSSLANAPTTSSGLVRHSSLGPGPAKGAAGPTPSGVVRAGSAGPRASTVKAGGPVSRRNAPIGTGRKKPSKSLLSKVKKASSRNSPASTAGSDLSDAESGSGDDGEGADGRSRGSPAVDGKDDEGDDILGDADDDEDAGDDKKYCLCHNVSYGDMVACDNEDCPYEWFHWTCVGLKSEPNGLWYCPECSENLKKKGK